jgi:hypothetical protein
VAKDYRLVAVTEWLMVATAMVFQWTSIPHTLWGDADTRFETLVQLVDQGKVSSARYSILHSLLSAPLYMVGKLFGKGSEAITYFNVLVFHLTIVALFFVLRKHVPRVILRRAFLLLLTASMFGYHVQTYYGEVLTACAAMIGISALAVNRPWLAGTSMCMAVVNVPSAFGALGLCYGLWALRTRRWFHAAWPLVAAPLLVALEYYWRRGWPLRSGYETDAGWSTISPYSGHGGFSYPLLLGIASLLFSFGKGIVVYQPGLILQHLGLPAKRDAVQSMLGRLGMAFLWGMILAHASWWAWHGSIFWGPRFLLIAAMPASFALAMHLSSKQRRSVAVTLVLVGAVAWSLWVGVNATIIHEGYPEACTAQDCRYEPLCWFVPEFSPLIHPLIKFPQYRGADLFYLYFSAAVVLVLIIPVLVKEVRELAVQALARSQQLSQTLGEIREITPPPSPYGVAPAAPHRGSRTQIQG